MEESSKVEINITIIALAMLFAFLGLIFGGFIGINFPLIVRYVVIFLYFAFLPGILILNILKIKLKFTDLIIFSFGLSLSFITISSLFENIIAVLFNIENPISLAHLTVFYAIIMISLILLAKWRNCTIITIDRSDSLNLKTAVILFIPIFAIFGGISLKYYGNNHLLLLLLVIISIIPIFSLYLKEKYYLLIIWAVSFSLLIHTNLSYAGTSLYETYLPGIVYKVEIWDHLFPNEQNSLLTTTLMIPVFSKLMGMDIIWGVQIISWIAMSFIPIGIYKFHYKFHGSKVAFLSSFLFIFMSFYYTQEWVMYAQRTAFALVFMILFLLLTFSEIEQTKKKILFPFFFFPLIASHYGAAYFFLITLSIFMLLKKVFKIEGVITLSTYITYILLLLFWYIFSSSGSNILWIETRILDIWNNFYFFKDQSHNHVLQLVASTTSYSIEVEKYLTIVIVLLSISGAFVLVLKNNLKRCTEYELLCISSVLIMLTQLLPESMGQDRLFSMVLVFSAPLCILSFLFFLKPLNLDRNKKLAFFSVFLFVFFIFGSGISSNIVNSFSGKTIDYSINRQMDRLAIQESDGIGKWLLYWSYRLEYTVDATEWFTIHNSGKPVYLDWCIYEHFLTHEGTSDIFKFYNVNYGGKKIFENMRTANKRYISDMLCGTTPLNSGDYVFLTHHNIIENSIVADEQTVVKTSDCMKRFAAFNCIYNNGGNIVYQMK